MKHKLIALLLVAIMTLSACAAVGVTMAQTNPTVSTAQAATTATVQPAAKQYTTLTFYAPGIADSYTIFVSGTLTTIVGNHPIPNGVVQVLWNDGGTWTKVASATTNSNGFFSCALPVHTIGSTNAVAQLRALYDGSTTMDGTTSATVSVSVEAPTALELSAPGEVPAGASFAIGGTLTDLTSGKTMGGSTVQLYESYYGAWSYVASTVTHAVGNNGGNAYSFVVNRFSGTHSGDNYVRYYVKFAGSDWGWVLPSTSNTVIVNNENPE